ncbi:MAG TPA: protein-disulfide reductase DsbD domain-containing protein [Candidatus Limnocylindria bacterium]|nr:protein-disulfide reductase DsbD domain-containing protein [Candidatus Limnocylindria bacterium]
MPARLVIGLLLALTAFARLTAESKTQAELLVDHVQARPGETVLAALRLRMAPGWHTYWKNPGESGKPTRLKWTLPEGVKVGEIRWPIPEKAFVLDQFVYVYEDETVLLIPVDIATTVPAGKLELKAQASWLECEKICVPGSAQVSATLEIADASTPSPNARLFTDAIKRLPGGNAVPVHGRWLKGADDKSRTLELAFKPTKPGKWEFLPNPLDNIDFAGETKSANAGPMLSLTKVAKKFEGEWPAAVGGVMVMQSPDGKPLQGFEFTSMGEAVAAPVVDVPTDSGPGFLAMLGFAFIGGLILNIMPCVLPVIALKILGFVNQSRKEPRRIRFLGLMYGAGVIASFLILASAVIGIRYAGGNAIWGQQYQSPVFIVGMTALVLLVALNLFGVFEVQLGGRAMNAAYSAGSKAGAGGAFFNGVFATLLATPCTAPFLGASLGFAFTKPPGTILLFFIAAGVGLALPYVLLCWQPAWLKFLPKPGDWMVKFKTIMGFPMLGTALWLYGLAFNHYGASKMLPLGLFLVAVALGAWIYGEFVQKRPDGSWLATGVTVAWLAVAYVWLLEGEVNWRHPAPVLATSGTKAEPNSLGMLWEPWSNDAVERAQRDKRPILVDFTADWCTTCQYNKRVAIEVEPVAKRLKELNAVTLLADFSREDPRILAELKKYKRAGVPLVLVYPPIEGGPPQVLPEFLTKQIVLKSLERALN